MPILLDITDINYKRNASINLFIHLFFILVFSLFSYVAYIEQVFQWFSALLKEFEIVYGKVFVIALKILILLVNVFLNALSSFCVVCC